MAEGERKASGGGVYTRPTLLGEKDMLRVENGMGSMEGLWTGTDGDGGGAMGFLERPKENKLNDDFFRFAMDSDCTDGTGDEEGELVSVS